MNIYFFLNLSPGESLPELQGYTLLQLCAWSQGALRRHHVLPRAGLCMLGMLMGTLMQLTWDCGAQAPAAPPHDSRLRFCWAVRDLKSEPETKPAPLLFTPHALSFLKKSDYDPLWVELLKKIQNVHMIGTTFRKGPAPPEGARVWLQASHVSWTVHSSSQFLHLSNGYLHP